MSNMRRIPKPKQLARGLYHGKPVYLADDDLEIGLLDPDFKGTTPRSTDDCPIVHACQRLFGCSAEVGRAVTYLEFKEYAIRYRTLGLARLVTEAFDIEALKANGGTIRLGRIPASGREARIPGTVSGSGTGNPEKVRIDNPLLRPRVRT